MFEKDGMPLNQELDQQVEQEIEQPQEENLQQETQENEQKVESNTLKSKSNDKEENFKRLRNKTEQLEKERDEAVKYARELYVKYNQPQQPIEEEDLNIIINPDDIVEGKHLSKVDKKIRKLEEQIKNYQQKTTEMALETQIRAQYPDFDKIVTKDNIDALRETDPDIADAIYQTPDLYKKATLAYKMIKKMGITQEDLYSQDRELAQKNAMKPKAVNSISPQQGESPMSKANAFANGLTDELKEQLYKEMIEARKKM